MEQRRRVLRWSFVIYGVFVLMLWFLRKPGVPDLPYWQAVRQYLNLKPFQSIPIFLYIIRNNPHAYLRFMAVANLAGNIVLFIPLGFLLPAVFTRLRTFFKTIGLSAVIISAAEVIQMLTFLGNCDIDDLLFNLTGACIGYWFFLLIRQKWPRILP